jgi:hypothetical protein
VLFETWTHDGKSKRVRGWHVDVTFILEDLSFKAALQVALQEASPRAASGNSVNSVHSTANMAFVHTRKMDM